MESVDQNPAPPQRYDALVERALAFVAERPEGVPEDMLVGHVFGSSTSPALWRDLLRSVLSENARLSLGQTASTLNRSGPPSRSRFPPNSLSSTSRRLA
ncbi:MAG: hypothetical protein R2849_17670 [Thermomicrobiales bacterium]